VWVDNQGVCHTVAWPAPADLMSEDFRQALDRLRGEQAEVVMDLVAAEEDRFYKEQTAFSVSGPEERRFEGVAPPAQLMDRPVETVEELRLLILEIDRRWRLDALIALDDYLS